MRLRLRENDLAKVPGSDLIKAPIARETWDQTTVSMTWINAKLAMKSAANASIQIRRISTMKNPTRTLPAALCQWINQS